MTCSISGVFTALITPFDQNDTIDIDGFLFHLQRQKDAHVDGVVVLGTTGEAATLSQKEKEFLIKTACSEKNLQVIVGCGCSSTWQTIENVQTAASLGADAVLVCAPVYNKPTQEGIVRHWEEICRLSPLPVIAYNNPARTGINITVEMLTRIAYFPKMCGIKESSENISQISNILYQVKKERPDFALICGDDMLTFAVMALGGDGVISGGANLIPTQIVDLVQACHKKDFEKARHLNLALIPIFNALCLESNPIPLKAALELLGYPAGSPRLPLTPLNPKYIPKLEQVLLSRDVAYGTT